MKWKVIIVKWKWRKKREIMKKKNGVNIIIENEEEKGENDSNEVKEN